MMLKVNSFELYIHILMLRSCWSVYMRKGHCFFVALMFCLSWMTSIEGRVVWKVHLRFIIWLWSSMKTKTHSCAKSSGKTFGHLWNLNSVWSRGGERVFSTLLIGSRVATAESPGKLERGEGAPGTCSVAPLSWPDGSGVYPFQRPAKPRSFYSR